MRRPGRPLARAHELREAGDAALHVLEPGSIASSAASRARASPGGGALDVAGLLVIAERAQRPLALLLGLAARLAAEAEPLQPRDLQLAEQPRRVLGRQAADQRADA